MTDGERVQLYNDLCDFKDELEQIHYPVQTKKIDIIRRAIEYVRGNPAKWLSTEDTQQILSENRLAYLFPVKCSVCGFKRGFSDFKYCPQCISRMQKR